jgi:NitT/TauT family transport system ATP-binding protein/nitrate/nitrite transport system substrate-binding protein
MARWDIIDPALDLDALARRVYRPDLYRAIAAPLGLAVPRSDSKVEGAHQAPWQLDATPAPIAMGPDNFCDGAVFDETAAPVAR